MRIALVVAAVLGCSCLNFDTRLAACRTDAGVWSCPDDGGKSTPPPPDADGPEGLLCTRGWCWDHPRPTGATLKSIWGTSATDLWVGGGLGTLIHFDGTKWESHDQEGRYDFSAICGHSEAQVYFGAGRSGGFGNRLFTWNGVGVSEVPESADDIHQLACSDTSLWIAGDTGASRLDWGARAPSVQFTVPDPSSEFCTGVAPVSPGDCVVACAGKEGGRSFARMRRCDGSVEFELNELDGGFGNLRTGALWTDPNRGVLAGVSGERSELWQRNQGWGPVWTTPTISRAISGGAPWATGSIAVGAYGVELDVSAAGITEHQVTSAGNSYLTAVWSPPSGAAWVVDELGCILERDAGSWVPRSDCAVQFEDFATVPRLAAMTTNALYRRTPTGWVWERDLGGTQVALWENPDGGGFAYLSEGGLRYGDTNLAISFNNASALYVVSEEQVVVADGRLLINTNLIDGRASAFDAGVSISRLAGDGDGTVWAAGNNGTLLHWTAEGGWVRETTGLTDDITDFAIGFGRQWALSATTLATRPAGGAWKTGPVGGFERVVAVGVDQALVINTTDDGRLINSTFATGTVSYPPPDRLLGRIVVRGSEIWAVGGQGGLVRFPIPH